MAMKTLKIVIVNLIVLAVLFACAELVFTIMESYQKSQDSQWYGASVKGGVKTDTVPYIVYKDPLLGYRGKCDVSTVSTLTKGSQSIYSAVYTMNRAGWRVTPHDTAPVRADHPVTDVVFTGCSFTFGEGVADAESLPYRFEQGSRGKCRAYNVALPGYGPQHALRVLDSGEVRTIVDGQSPLIVVYSAANFHIPRAAFKWPYNTWATPWPRYGLDASGDVSLFEGKSYVPLAMPSLFGRSRLLAALYDHMYNKRMSASDLRLFLAMIRTMRDHVEDGYGGRFYVFYWDVFDVVRSNAIMTALRRDGITVFSARDGLEIRGTYEYASRYALSDHHPNARAYERIAAYLLRMIPLAA